MIRVRPHVMQNGNVDLIVNLEISRIVPGTKELGNFIFDRREVTTHVIVRSGQTVMLSGIIQQDQSEEVHKVPLLGDIPLLGALFRSIDKSTNNRELVAFVTPNVIDTEAQLDQQMEEPLQTIGNIQKALGSPDAAQDDSGGPAGNKP
jgi:type II secretory pathway component GspD/PulD (secretin)